MERIERRTLIYWLALGSLALICCLLAYLQYTWIGDISRAEEESLKSGLQSTLQRLSQNFNSEIEAACAALQPSPREVDEQGRANAYAARFEQWRSSTRHPELFRAVGIAIPDGNDLALLIFDSATGSFSPGEWPANWFGMRQQLMNRLQRGGPPFPPGNSTVFEVPRFSPSSRPGERRGEQDWLVVDVNIDYLRSLLPVLIATHLGTEYDAEVYSRAEPANIIYQSRADGRRILQSADAVTPLFGIRLGEIARRTARPGLPGQGMPPGPPGPGFGMPGVGEGRWQLAVRSQAGSLAALVNRTRQRNLALSGLILILLVVTVGLLVHFSRKAQQLADLQMNFVTGVSHELRTPLTVIRTAAFNLRGKLGSNPASVEKYGALIQDEAEKLTALVEQVLRFAGARAGRVISDRSPVAVRDLLDHFLASRRAILEAAGVIVETKIDEGLPLMLADEMAVRHAVQNLVDNAVKYGTQTNKWIGISASRAAENGVDAIELRVADRGPGVPVNEQAQIFDPFFRGRRAIEDQIHGTGLGLNFVKKIAEAHGGSVRVISSPSSGTEFVMRIPTAPPEPQNEFAPSFG